VIHAPAGPLTAPIAAQVSGKTYRFGENDQKMESATLDLTGDSGGTLTIQDDAGAHRIEFGIGVWKTGTTTFLQRRIWPRPSPMDTGKVAVNGAWTDDDTLTLKLSYYETPFGPTLTFRFTDDRLLLDLRGNVGFGPSERPTIEGQQA
jgi:hypothetical protein